MALGRVWGGWVEGRARAQNAASQQRRHRHTTNHRRPPLQNKHTRSVVRWRLFREACACHEGSYVKDLSVLGRPLEGTVIIDNSPASYVFQPVCA